MEYKEIIRNGYLETKKSIRALERRIEELPKGSLDYSKINGKKIVIM